MRLSVFKRYQDDAQFHALVDTIYGCLLTGDFTPTEIREAAMVAACKYEMSHVRSIILSKEEWDALDRDVRDRLSGYAS